MTARTEAQKHALKAAYKILATEFDHVLIACSLDADHDQDSIGTDLDVCWKGSWLVANGLADFAKRRIDYQKRNNAHP
jgi:hypothetical protein